MDEDEIIGKIRILKEIAEEFEKLQEEKLEIINEIKKLTIESGYKSMDYIDAIRRVKSELKNLRANLCELRGE